MASAKTSGQKTARVQPGNTSSLRVSVSATTSLRGIQNLVSALAQLGMSATIRVAGSSTAVKSAVATISGRDVASAVIALSGKKK